VSDSTQYLVWRPEETRGVGSGPSSLIPTIGSAASAIDQYRIVSLASTNLPELGAAFTDVDALVALTKIAEGGITGVADLEAAETALQALLLHDIVYPLIPAPKVDFGNGLISYCRPDGGRRSQLAFDLINSIGGRDHLVAPEFLIVEEGIVRASTMDGSSSIGRTLEAISSNGYSDTLANEAINVAAETHGIPAYLASKQMQHLRRGDGFQKRFYGRLQTSWAKATGDIPPIVCSFSLPPLLAVVLHRANHREDLASVIDELRQELADARAELRDFNASITRTSTAAEIEARVRRLDASFDAIVPESRLSPAERRKRRILSFQGLVRPVLKFAMAFATKSGASLADGLNAAGGARDLIIESRALIDRTVTARSFVGLMQTESLQALVQHHLKDAEIAAIEKSLRHRQS